MLQNLLGDIEKPNTGIVAIIIYPNLIGKHQRTWQDVLKQHLFFLQDKSRYIRHLFIRYVLESEKANLLLKLS